MNYPAGALNDPQAPYNQVEPDELTHPRHCPNCRHFLKVYGWELEDAGESARRSEWVWFTRCRWCEAMVTQDA